MTDTESEIQAEAENDSIECRACLQIMNADSVLYNIFESWTPPWDGMENSIAEDLAKIANLQISETDRHSKVICETCCHLLLNACNFTAIVKKNDLILRQRYADDTTEHNSSNERVWPKPIQVDKSLASSMYDNSMNVEIKQEVLSDEENEYPALNGTYDTSREEIPNLDIIKIEPEEMIQQQPLQIQVTVNGNVPLDHLNSSEPHLTNGNIDNGDHLDAQVKEEPLSEEDDVDPIHSDLSLECMLCMKAFNSVTGLKAHVIAQHSYKSVKRKCNNSLSPEKKKCKYICAICRRTFTTSTDLMVHETCHNKSVCYGCNESFDTFAQLTVHRRTCKALSSKEVTKLKTLDDVLRPQTKEQTNELKCAHCEETFSDVYYMNIHQEIHHSNSEENEADDKNYMEVDDVEKVFTSSKKAKLSHK
ncbi:zinc finger protein 624-like isoform X1 [Vanessa cardui]|uniref:zinc finger protein 624-like isoform X1 n=1 Tax=Vanessa cardui TaxID=171605 RepID=UPI001F1476D4|nr:zinc finger protein 624-like isoform X1 [Vanessa cardui]XP_046973545.1 zinc finger protein 624-like isoform X1 [Vanessa cardui]XP_046973554.1 zinc finger protein 624-like isoform X1 [Vanessa cardui]